MCHLLFDHSVLEDGRILLLQMRRLLLVKSLLRLSKDLHLNLQTILF
jgi:hypothetical protein